MVYVFMANGTEEVEAIAAIDMLRRAELDVCTVGVGGEVVTCSHGVTVGCDIPESVAVPDETVQAVVLPGGMPGTLNLEKSPVVQKFIDYAIENDKVLAAICAAPSILGHRGLLKGKKAICFPGFEQELEGAVIADEPVCKDGNIITGKGAGVAVDFGLAIAAELAGEAAARAVRASIQCR